DNHLSSEARSFHWWVIFAVTSNVATSDVFDRHDLYIEAHIVPRKSFTQSFMVHFNRLYFCCDIDWSKDQVAGCGGLARIYVSNDDDVD
ncbi:hypothetical protein A6R68_21180, partial [Neotoma lepida]